MAYLLIVIEYSYNFFWNSKGRTIDTVDGDENSMFLSLSHQLLAQKINSWLKR